MKTGLSTPKTVTRTTAALLAVGACTALSSCWFNTAGYIFDQASYKATSDTADLRLGSNVFMKDGSFYIELPRYKTGTGPKLLYGTGSDGKREDRHTESGTQTFRIPTDYARYLIGHGDKTYNTSSLVLTPVSENVAPVSEAMYPVVNTPESIATTYGYTSPNAGWLYPAGTLDLLCVDLPMSAAFTGLGIAGKTLQTTLETAFTIVTFGAGNLLFSSSGDDDSSGTSAPSGEAE